MPDADRLEIVPVYIPAGVSFGMSTEIQTGRVPGASMVKLFA
jgi:hypothetical protein